VVATSQSEYKLKKDNNRLLAPDYLPDNLRTPFFRAPYPKWDWGGLCSRETYSASRAHLPPLADMIKILCGLLNAYGTAFETLDVKRIFPGIPMVLWMHNGWHDHAMKVIKEKTAEDPNYLLYNPIPLSSLNEYCYTDRPLNTEELHSGLLTVPYLNEKR